MGPVLRTSVLGRRNCETSAAATDTAFDVLRVGTVSALLRELTRCDRRVGFGLPPARVDCRVIFISRIKSGLS